MLRIDLTALDDGVHHLTLEPTAADLDLEPEAFGDLRVEVQLDLFNGRAHVELQTYATATMTCDRTLVPFDQTVEGTHELLFVPPAVAERMEADEEVDEEIRVLHPADRGIDVTDAVRDTILLSLPTRRIAPGAEDLDIETVFGDDPDGIDPRWEALRTLRADDEAAE